jgi:hypothetical protein
MEQEEKKNCFWPFANGQKLLEVTTKILINESQFNKASW